MNVAALLRSARLAKGLSQAEIARRCGLDRAHVARLESGQRRASLDTLSRLVDLLEIDPRAVFGEAPLGVARPPLGVAEPTEAGYAAADPVARLIALRGFASRDEAVQVAVEEALARAVAEPRTCWSALIGAARGPGENPTPRFRSDDDLWGDA